ncbi:dTDP-4-dehydrorhamnose 3,5-epimerase family protein [Bacillus solitudinis]|uniref:dTDP-4-dehydrorhamnose 3,5-epimerase family protein n=1 Tax=Bacillus solitudinis TaxID=2014074 RepID=UPI000C249506|nr:dTDP-4-dehydrorhamnose 3,5-epimerase family protein [Bacillus solitudinis]
MIEGVKIKRIEKHCDDRGFFTELVRDDEDILARFGQASMSVSYPGIIKAFHYHDEQDDIWFFLAGNAQVVLHDLRGTSTTKGMTDVYYMGEENPIILRIPSGVAHGYRVLGNRSATIIYFTTKAYNPKSPDEKRIPWNDPSIGFDWETKNR